MSQAFDHVLVVGGTSGLGLELAKQLRAHSGSVAVLGRSAPRSNEGLSFFYSDLSYLNSVSSMLAMYDLLSAQRSIDLLVYAAGFYQEGTVGQLTFGDIEKMLNVGALGPALFLNAVLLQQGRLPGFIGITSTSQWIPRKLEPIYSFVKAGFAAFARSVSLDPAIGKVLLVAPAGMKTSFWNGTAIGTSTMLDPAYVAEKTLACWFGEHGNRELHILREPPRTESRPLIRYDNEW